MRKGVLKRLRRRLGRLMWFLAGVLLLFALGSAAGYVWLQKEFRAAGPAAFTSRIEVAPGTSLRAVLGRLEAMGALRSAYATEAYLRLRGRRLRIQAGLYELPPRASAQEIVVFFEQGRVVLEQLTVVEGATFAEFLEALAVHPHVLHTLRGRAPAQVMAVLGHPGVPAEGQFFPDTYRFSANTADVAILALAYDSMQRALASAWAVRNAELPFETPYQALILASIVEKEAELKSERARIAGVFARRLRLGMRLQSDPTVIYGLGERYDGSIHTRDLLADTPYNTYTREGLPPTPVALPGRESLRAAVQPEATDALYFVATGRGDGAHHFSRTLEEHNSAVKAYLTRLRGQEHGSHPKPPAQR